MFCYQIDRACPVLFEIKPMSETCFQQRTAGGK
jgi:hypothetical protein